MRSIMKGIQGPREEGGTGLIVQGEKKAAEQVGQMCGGGFGEGFKGARSFVDGLFSSVDGSCGA